MIETQKINVDGMDFQIQAMPALKALRLDKKVITLLVPVLGGLKGMDLTAELDFSVIASGISEALQGMPDAEFEILVKDLLSEVIYLQPGCPAEQLTPEKINLIFRGKLLTIYKLLMEVMKVNKFTPFALGQVGSLIPQILTSPGQNKKESKRGGRLAMSADLLAPSNGNGLSGE